VKAYRLQNSSPKPVLVEEQMATPKPGRGEILVRVHAAAITPSEIIWYPTHHNRDGSPRLAAVPCHEFSGEVAEAGEGVRGFSRGQEVYGMNDWFDEGALAAYCVTKPEWIAAKPRTLSHEEAAAVPISALTAWQGLFDRARLQAGDRVLIHGGAGSVGMFAIQLARQHGAEVIASVSAHDLEYAKSLGAAVALDYQARPFEEVVPELDVVFDAVGGETLRRSWQVLKPGGRLVTIAADSEAATEDRVKQAFFIVEPSTAQLLEIGKRVDLGTLQTSPVQVEPFSAARLAFAGAPAAKRRGKVVVAVQNDAGLPRD
jgi:NADPH:quinone reductase-like Zn-dependent oxidoreductase